MPLCRSELRLHSRRWLYRVLLAALLTLSCPISFAMSASSASDAAMAEYRRKLAEYTAAREDYDQKRNAYWSSIAEKRRLRDKKRRNNEAVSIDDYVLSQPPVYSGPPEPIDPSAPKEEPPPATKKYIPVVADFVRSAGEQFNFAPRRPDSEIEYKRAYARIASAAGLTREQIVRIYAFEAGGNGTYDVQAGLENPTPQAQAISTALGYNQLLATNSVELLAEKGDLFISILKTKAASLPAQEKASLVAKTAVLQQMVNFTRTVPDDWSEHQKLADTPQGLAVHALLLDLDVGPLLQTQKLLDSVVFARTRGYIGSLSAVELEMMNLTGDGNGIDMVTMPAALRDQVPTANFFQSAGYRANPIAIRNNTVAKLLAATDAKMDRESKLQGARDMAAAF
jgi:hypothetical protein